VIFRGGREGADPELLMVVRSRKMSFAGGMAVFPGGRVDPADYDLGRQLARGRGSGGTRPPHRRDP
jgi:8-oxo-dGTP pyrophosphatase MutT (NUDIX family)